ncbi:MAG: Ca-activated chloride channel [Pyrinomonadaceae bacterium]|jgi:Ca-activated chloride channel family protein|nr:Ca-activated chloride channel [Pyrinomonadaceae bacterium]
MTNGNWGKHFGPVLLIAVLALCFCCGSVNAQNIRDFPPPPPAPTPKPTPKPAPPKDEDFDVIKVNSNLVMVPVSVVDATGQPIHGLQVNDFRLDEEGRAQQIVEIGNPDQVPLDIALLFDVSSSVSNKGFFAFQQKAAAAFLKQVLKPADRAAVFTITDQPRLVEPLASAEIAAARLLMIPAASSPVPTAFYDTVVAAAKYLNEKSADRHRRVILVISDGDDNFSNLIKDLTVAEVRAEQKGETTPAAARQNLLARRQRAVSEVQRAVQQADVAFYSINPGGPSVHLNLISTRAQNDMASIAQSTGGTAYVPDSDKDLERVFGEVAAELRGQYLLQYYSNSQAPGVLFRRIAVGLPTHPELRVRARQGYYPKQR